MTDALIVGCGYVGKWLARHEMSAGNAVWGLVRTERSEKELTALNIKPIRADLDEASRLRSMPSANSVIYYLVTPSSHGNGDRRIASFLSVLEQTCLPKRIVLLSTTGVYGDCKGEWITEQTPVNPQAARSKRRLAVEIALRKWAIEKQVEFVILRVPGIYGPGRLPEQRLREQQPVLCEEESPYSNRIHVDDLANACYAAGRNATVHDLYNISDDQPSTMTDYFFQVADVLGIHRPPELTREQAQQQLSSGMLSYLSESKRIDNRKFKEELGIKLLYPSLKEGLAACIDVS